MFQALQAVQQTDPPAAWEYCQPVVASLLTSPWPSWISAVAAISDARYAPSLPPHLLWQQVPAFHYLADMKMKSCCWNVGAGGLVVGRLYTVSRGRRSWSSMRRRMHRCGWRPEQVSSRTSPASSVGDVRSRGMERVGRCILEDVPPYGEGDDEPFEAPGVNRVCRRIDESVRGSRATSSAPDVRL